MPKPPRGAVSLVIDVLHGLTCDCEENEDEECFEYDEEATAIIAALMLKFDMTPRSKNPAKVRVYTK